MSLLILLILPELMGVVVALMLAVHREVGPEW